MSFRDLRFRHRWIRFGLVIAACSGALAVALPAQASAAAPVVTTITPADSPAAGGGVVALGGSGFTGATAVNFGPNQSASFTVVSDTQIMATVPAGPSSTSQVNVTVTTPSGTAAPTSNNVFIYGPTVNDVLTQDGGYVFCPPDGPTAGGNEVFIFGTSLSHAVTQVYFGNTPAESFQDYTDTGMMAVAPPGTGTVDITVVGLNGWVSQTSSEDQYTYVAPTSAPVVTGLSQQVGLTGGGYSIYVLGRGMDNNVTGVFFGRQPATSFTPLAESGLVAVAPPGTAGTVHVTVDSSYGNSTKTAADEFTYTRKWPTVTAVSPRSGPWQGGTTVTITGTDFTVGSPATVNFGTKPATSVTVVSSKKITAVAPQASSNSTADITVTAPVATSPSGATLTGTSTTSPADQFSWGPPLITSMSATSGPSSGGTTVQLTGVNYTGATGVTFGNTAATSFTVNSDSSITAEAPPGSGTEAVRVTNADGPSRQTSADLFTYGP
jgi:hypothetical protein